MVMVSTNPQVVRKVVSVQYHGRNDDDPSDIMAFDENIVANYITSLLYKFLQFDSNFNIMLVFAHSYDIQPFQEKYLKEFNTTIMGCQDREDSWSSYRERQSNILLTYKMAMLDACLYTDMVIFVDYLPNLDDYSLAVHSLKDGSGFCYMVFDPETVEVDDNNISLYQENDLQGQLKKYISILDSKSNPIQLDPDMQMLASMLEMEENAAYSRNYYDAVIN